MTSTSVYQGLVQACYTVCVLLTLYMARQAIHSQSGIYLPCSVVAGSSGG